MSRVRWTSDVIPWCLSIITPYCHCTFYSKLSGDFVGCKYCDLLTADCKSSWQVTWFVSVFQYSVFCFANCNISSADVLWIRIQVLTWCQVQLAPYLVIGSPLPVIGMVKYFKRKSGLTLSGRRVIWITASGHLMSVPVTSIVGLHRRCYQRLWVEVGFPTFMDV